MLNRTSSPDDNLNNLNNSNINLNQYQAIGSVGSASRMNNSGVGSQMAPQQAPSPAPMQSGAEANERRKGQQ